MSTDMKKVVKDNRNDFNLHVALLMRDGHSKPDSLIIAYCEGRNGLKSRLGKAEA